MANTRLQQQLKDETYRTKGLIEEISQLRRHCTDLSAKAQVLTTQLGEKQQLTELLDQRHKHSRESLEHFRQASREQWQGLQRQHEQQVQYLKAEVRTATHLTADKQQQLIDLNRDNAQLVEQQRQLRNVAKQRSSRSRAALPRRLPRSGAAEKVKPSEEQSVAALKSALDLKRSETSHPASNPT